MSSDASEPAAIGRKRPALLNARRDAVVLAVLIAAVLLLLWNGSSFFAQLKLADNGRAPDIQIMSTALTLNVALILFGWRRYADLQHESELRADGERRAAQMATTEPITGLYNRKGFADGTEALRTATAASGGNIVIISLQVHRFKAVSDRHGYDTGEALLKKFSEGLRTIARPGSIIARLSGDEFAIAFALDDPHGGIADGVAENLLREICRPQLLGDRMIQVGAYAGIAAVDAGDAAIPDLLRRADIALDHARSGRAARPVWFDEGMERALLEHSEIEQGIRYGLEHGQFVPFFEPQVDLATGRIIGFEVLARWIHPLRGIIGPDVFIPVAEEIGAIGRLSEHVVGEALAAAAGWDPAIRISINISPLQFADGWLAQRIVRILTETRFPASRLVVEITESSLFTDLDLAQTIVTGLKNQGIALALDDFGTGFSSLSHLSALPFDMIKVDRSFVANLTTSRQSLAIVRAVTAMASAIGVPVCVEGIENEGTHAAVLQLGCEIGQGWYFGKPMPVEQAARMLADEPRDDDRRRAVSA